MLNRNLAPSPLSLGDHHSQGHTGNTLRSPAPIGRASLSQSLRKNSVAYTSLGNREYPSSTRAPIAEPSAPFSTFTTPAPASPRLTERISSDMQDQFLVRTGASSSSSLLSSNSSVNSSPTVPRPALNSESKYSYSETSKPQSDTVAPLNVSREPPLRGPVSNLNVDTQSSIPMTHSNVHPLGSPHTPQYVEPYTPAVDPEIPPEIPQISNLRGGRGLIKRFQTTHTTKPVPETPPASSNSNSSVLHQNPYATPDPTPRKPAVYTTIPPPTDTNTAGFQNSLEQVLVSMKTTCAICLDENLLTLNATPLKCGSFAHRACLVTTTMSLRGSNMNPICGLCGKDCIVKRSRRAATPPTPLIESGARSPGSLRSSFQSVGSRASVGRSIRGSVTEELLEIDCDVEPLRTKAFIHRSGNRCEMGIRVACNPAGQRSLWRHENARCDRKKNLRKGYEVLNLTPLDYRSVEEKEAFCGQLRLVSKFSDNKNPVLHGYLFENCIIFAGDAPHESKYFYRFYDLRSDSLAVYVSDGMLVIRELGDAATSSRFAVTPSDPPHRLTADIKTVMTWMSAINDKKLDFVYNPISPKDPLDESLETSPFSAGFVESSFIEVVVCIPHHLLASTVANLVGEMNPQDRLAFVIVFPNGSLRTIASHKISWPHWSSICEEGCNVETLLDCTEHTPTKAAENLLTRRFPGKQQTIIVAASSGNHEDLESSFKYDMGSSTINYYLIGCTSEDELFPRSINTDLGSTFRHYHGSTPSEVLDIVKGIFVSERHYRHRDVHIRIEPTLPAGVRSIEARGLQRTTILGPNAYEVSLGSILAGQYKTVLFDIELDEIASEQPLRNLFSCDVTSISTASLQPYTQTNIPIQELKTTQSPQFFFDHMVRRLGEKLLAYSEAPSAEVKLELERLSDETIESVQKAVNYFERDGADRLSYVGEFVLDYDPMFSNAAMNTRAKHLAWGFCQLERELNRLPQGSAALRYKLVELMQTLDTHHSVICRNDLERIFFEALPNNKI